MLLALPLSALLSCGTAGLTEMPPPDSGHRVNDSGETGDSAADDTGSGAAGSAPQISLFETSEDGGRLRFAFQVKDSDDDLTGGSVTIKVPPRFETYDWAGSEMSVSNGTASIYWDVATIQADADLTALLTVTDAAGHESAVAESVFRHDTSVYYVNEDGDKKADAHGLGNIVLPVEIHGDIYAAGNNGSEHTKDSDWIKFAVPTSGNVTFTLTWKLSSADYDLYLFNENDSMLGWSDTFTQPETFGMDLPADTNFFLKVGGWDGAASDWTLTLTR